MLEPGIPPALLDQTAAQLFGSEFCSGLKHRLSPVVAGLVPTTPFDVAPRLSVRSSPGQAMTPI